MLRALILFLTVLTGVSAAGVPTPKMALKFDIGRDTKKWDGKLVSANQGGFIFELVPKGENPDQWTELVQQQIVFCNISVRDFVDGWKRRMRSVDPKITISEQNEKDDSVLVAYASKVGDEISVRRFLGSTDGIYMLAYQVRPILRDNARLSLWIDIISSANLIPNPQR